MDDILKGYAEAATPELISRFDNLDCREIYAPVIDLLPSAPCRIADIGSGTGRDAAWFAAQGHDVLAVEPVEELREPGMRLHPSDKITWLDDSLPDLAEARLQGVFDLVVLCGVWHHVDHGARQTAMENLAEMTATGGLLIMSLRHGPAPEGRRAFAISPAETTGEAARFGFTLVRQAEVASIQAGNRAVGVHWTWIALRKTG
ncbi:MULTISPECIES: class I SAM-dependent methyltransferase [unclassified Agrobacterium]|uniref:class I SAM-dependent methyltransferase n=1 Tax=unclassified Agrobacterium TaxID=2632611 RepID=UPI00244B8903|nr:MULTISPECIES: class I SAM-dependent methyltransferase [unclassified Agrobacterium]MDH0616419.1 class I SAM-dependent methyltransferase [Agrobacterium sp. GD03872]MDH0699136.1 class I SAM-dependent methyltransferase [Agrobacterium sp. GD03871]MDH1061737.1 class I SAM-dependent methyltransferase [Agrobacterium sp. GD03992]MDH2213334.1 class I SAM-dependent methyltransferase [Agrobacterium sp. GD03643]MDH2222152.1 class I SAM-dependent methyltransferase [Agrobacterium sp. GD03638]